MGKFGLKSPWTIAIAATLSMGLLMVVLDRAFPAGGNIWRDWVTEEDTLVYFCEPATVKALFRHKVDTYTNLGFFFVGVMVLAFGKLDRVKKTGGFAVVHSVWS